MSLLSMCIPTPHKPRKDKKRSRLGPGGGVAPILDHFVVSTNVSQQQRKESTVKQYPASAQQNESSEKNPVDGGRNCCRHQGKPKTNNFHHPNYENDSQRSAASSSTSNESHSTSNESHSTHTSGYQTDDGTFEGKMLHLATKSRPANIRMTAVKDYNPCCNEELVLRRGQRVKVLYKNNDWVYAMTKNGEAGYVPYNYVRPSRKYAGYQSEPEYMADTDVYQSGYETDLPMSGGSRKCGGTRTQIEDIPHSYYIRTGFRSSPDNQQYNSQQQQQQQQQQPQCSHQGYRQPPQHHHGTRLESIGSGGYTPPASASPRSNHRFTNGYTSAVEYPTTTDTRRHPRPAKSLHNILDAGGSPTIKIQSVDRRPTEGKPEHDSFPRSFLEELVVIHDFEAHEEDEAFVSKGERVKVLNADDSFWLWVETTPGVQGFVPRSCCSLGSHPCLQSNSAKGSSSSSRNARRYYYQRSRAQMAARQARSQAKQRFHELARQRNNSQNPVLMDKLDIQRVGSKLIVLMDYTATQEDEISIQFAETVYADVLKQAGAERIWAYCPRSEKCGFVPVSLVVPPVV